MLQIIEGMTPALAALELTSAPVIVGACIVVVVFVAVLIMARRASKTESELIVKSANEKADDIRQQAKLEAENLIKEAKLKTKEEFERNRVEFERETASRKKELQKTEDRLASKEDRIDKMESEIETRIQGLKNREANLAAKEAEMHERTMQQVKELEHVAQMTQDEAKQLLLSKLEETMEAERAVLMRRFQEENKQQLQEEAQKIMVNAMQRYSGDCAYERTTAIIPLPNDDMKGRIIGREGRNIRTIEAATGVSLLIDDTPEAVVISCFDPVRREIARLTMEKLIADGRIHPARVEEIVAKVTKDVENDIQKTGNDAASKMGVARLKPNIVSLLGRLKYRYSFSQNVLMHSLEVASMMGAIAAQLGLDEKKAKRAGLLHDIGKAVDHEVEGTHAMIGADLLKRANEDEDIVNAVAAHHEEVEKTSLLAILVQICDTLSASRPGARSETTELYLKRLEQLEAIGNGFDGVENCFAIQAGRELRVVVQPEKISEERATILAHDMAEKIEKEMRYPGQIRVSIIRETRAVEYAK